MFEEQTNKRLLGELNSGGNGHRYEGPVPGPNAGDVSVGMIIVTRLDSEPAWEFNGGTDAQSSDRRDPITLEDIDPQAREVAAVCQLVRTTDGFNGGIRRTFACVTYGNQPRPHIYMPDSLRTWLNSSESEWDGGCPLDRAGKGINESEENRLRQEHPTMHSMRSALRTIMAQRQETPELDFSARSIIALPPEIGRFFKLRKLNVADNLLETLPVELGNLKALEELSLDSNPLRELSTSMRDLRSLTTLSLYECQLREFPPASWSKSNVLFSLETVDLRYNRKLFRLRAEPLGQMARLRSLNVGETALREIPDSLVRLNRLEEFECHNTKVRRLPSDIGSMRSLRTLRLDDCPLRTLPASLATLKTLEKLELGGVAIKASRHWTVVGHCVQLKELWINNNGLERLPPSFAQLTRLETLYAHRNKFKYIPEVILSMERLQVLGLRENRIKTLHVPPSAAAAPVTQSLVELDLSDNRLTTVHASVRMFKRLHSLMLNENQLITLPAELGNVTTLQELRVDENPLKTIPKAAIAPLLQLEKLDVDDTPFGKQHNITELRALFDMPRERDISFGIYRFERPLDAADTDDAEETSAPPSPRIDPGDPPSKPANVISE
jgi:Leucine-rich repeat (LRR) protein